jgi:ABC-type lipoprotein export system ATPase subunit
VPRRVPGKVVVSGRVRVRVPGGATFPRIAVLLFHSDGVHIPFAMERNNQVPATFDSPSTIPSSNDTSTTTEPDSTNIYPHQPNATMAPHGSKVAPSPRIQQSLATIEQNQTTSPSRQESKSGRPSTTRLSTVIQHPLTPTQEQEQEQQEQYTLQPRQPTPTTSTKNACIMLNNVHKTYLLGVEGVAALRGVSLTVDKGEFVMLLGKSGSGKTSLLNLIGTIDRQTRGDLRICNTWLRPTTSDSELAKLRLDRLGFVFQTFNLIPSMNALDNVALPMLLAGECTRAQAYKRAEQLLDDVGMGPRKTHVPSQLSGGEQQRVTIARALANRPDLLLLDEPTGDLDSVNTANVMQILTKLNIDMGVTMIMVTHDPHLRSYAHRAIHMLDGKIVRKEHIADGARAQLFTSKGIGHLLGRGYGTGNWEGNEQPPVDLEAAERKQKELEEEAAKVRRPLMLHECTMTEVRGLDHYARVLGGANKLPALMVKAMEKENSERRSTSTDE